MTESLVKVFDGIALNELTEWVSVKLEVVFLEKPMLGDKKMNQSLEMEECVFRRRT